MMVKGVSLFAVVGAGRHVIHVAAVADLVAVAISLGLVLVIDAIEAAIEIILIFAPGDSGHDMDAIAMFPPGLDSRRQIGVNTVNDGDIGTQIPRRSPRFARLERSTLENLIGIS